jgi:hypothetical protein
MAPAARDEALEAGERGDPAADGLRRLGFNNHGVAPALHVSYRGEEQPEGLLRPGDTQKSAKLNTSRR